MKNEFVGVVVYADDIVLLSPSIDGLQSMINTCTKYARNHNLTFSTHENPARSKTKCVAFVAKKRSLRNLNLDGKILPWVDLVNHLGTTIMNSNNGGCSLDQDLVEKRARYIAKNNEIRQEFYYAHPKTKVWINNVYNTSFYGSPLWDIYSTNFARLEKTWNVSIRLMLSIPRNAHRYLIEPLSGTQHIIKSIRNRFLRFVSNIASGSRKVLSTVLNIVKKDVRSVTGKNLRHINLKSNIANDGKVDVFKEPYKAIPKDEQWRIPLAKEIIETKFGNLSLNIAKEELDDILYFVCAS